MKKLMFITIIVMIAGLALYGVIYQYLYSVRELKIDSSGYIDMNKAQEDVVRVATILGTTSEVFKRYNLESLNINFQKNYLIISAGREIVKISYKKVSKHTGPFNDTYEAVIDLKDEFHPNRLYYYITEHIPCRVDVSAPQLYIEGRKIPLKELINP